MSLYIIGQAIMNADGLQQIGHWRHLQNGRGLLRQYEAGGWYVYDHVIWLYSARPSLESMELTPRDQLERLGVACQRSDQSRLQIVHDGSVSWGGRLNTSEDQDGVNLINSERSIIESIGAPYQGRDSIAVIRSCTRWWNWEMGQ